MRNNLTTTVIKTYFSLVKIANIYGKNNVLGALCESSYLILNNME